MQTLQTHFAMFANYNAWANRRLLAAVRDLSPADFHAEGGAFFKSIAGTLNHMLVTDRIWMHRFTGQGESYPKLDLILFGEIGPLEAARIVEDARVESYVAGLDDAALDGKFRYRRVSSPEAFEQSLAPALAHFFNHQTHHRGQAHGLLTGLGRTAPELDLLFFQREAGIV